MEKFKVLVVESERRTFEKFNNYLKEEYELINATSYSEAVEILRNKDDVINAVLLNLALKDKSGIKILEFMNNSYLSHRIPTVVLAKDIDRASSNRCHALRVAYIITAPFYSYTVRNVLKNSINLFRLERSNEVNGNSFVLEYYCYNDLFAFLKSENNDIDFFKLYSPDGLGEFIFEEDRAAFLTSLEKARCTSQSVLLSVRLKENGGNLHWYNACFKKSSEISVKETVIISLSDAQEIREKEAAAKRKTAILNIVSDVISNYFVGTFIVNLKTQSTVFLSPENDLTLNNARKDAPFSELLENYCRDFVVDDYKPVFKTCTDFNNILTRLQNGAVIDALYQKTNLSWLSIKIYKTIDYTPENPLTLWVFENATDRYEQFLIQRELRRKVRMSSIENEKLMLLAHTDSLTGMFNEKTFEEIVSERIENGKRGLFMMIDGDRFKAINDRYGHSVGDEVIKGVATAIIARTRDYDVSSRLHGDEFAVWVEDTEDEEIANRIIDDINKIIARISSQRNIPAVTVSAGFTAISEGDDYKSLYLRADKALYCAKEKKMTAGAFVKP